MDPCGTESWASPRQRRPGQGRARGRPPPARTPDVARPARGPNDVSGDPHRRRLGRRAPRTTPPPPSRPSSPASAAPSARTRSHRSRGGYRLAAPPDDVDLYVFERLVREGRAAPGRRRPGDRVPHPPRAHSPCGAAPPSPTSPTARAATRPEAQRHEAARARVEADLRNGHAHGRRTGAHGTHRRPTRTTNRCTPSSSAPCATRAARRRRPRRVRDGPPHPRRRPRHRPGSGTRAPCTRNC